MTPRVPRVALRTLVVDWSGAVNAREQRAKIQIAEARDGALLSVEGGRTRDDVAEWLIAEAARTPAMAIGFDFAFGFPLWFAQAHGAADGHEMIRVAAREGERWLAEQPDPFWGRRKQRPAAADPEHDLRRCDRATGAVGGIRPKSIFQIGGAGSVGTGALRGMPVLARLRDAGFRIWPFDDALPGVPVVFEVWPRLLTGPVVKSNASARRGAVAALEPAPHTALATAASASEDAFDAAMSAVALSLRPRSAYDDMGALDAVDRLEGRIWPGR